MADRNPLFDRAAGAAKKFYGLVTQTEVVAAVCIVALGAAFVLETRGHRNLFYLTAVPLFLLSLPRLGYRDLWGSALARLALAYLGYFFIAALWSDGLTLPALGNLLRVTLLALLFFVTASLLALRDRGFERRLYVWLSLVAGASLLAVFTALLAGTIVHEVRLGGFGIASHPVIGATLYGFVLLTSAFVLLPRSASWPARLLWLGVVGLCTAFMLLSGSRGPLIALAAALVLGLAIADRRIAIAVACLFACLLYTSPSPRDRSLSRMPSSA